VDGGNGLADYSTVGSKNKQNGNKNAFARLVRQRRFFMDNMAINKNGFAMEH
jgi:hypothetical protein